MKIVRFSYAGEEDFGLLEGEIIKRIKGDVLGVWQAGELVARLDQVQLLAPCHPTKVVAIGPNYMETFRAKGNPFPEEPVLFMKPPSAVIGAGAPIIYPEMSQQVSFEAELAIVMGKQARQIEEAGALNYVLGYTCANDMSAKDLQKKDGQWTRGKSFDTFCPLGPAIATGLNPDNLAIRSSVNGEIKQNSSTLDMLFKPAWLISYISRIMTLEPFDVIITGTPPGAGEVQAGDVIEIEIEGIGVLRNTVSR